MGRADTGLLFGPLSQRTCHLCIDVQRLFSREGPWPTPWMERVLPSVVGLAERHAERTLFTRFIPPARAEDARGTWRRFYERWRCVTRENADPRLLELVPALASLVPPARVFDKPVYSAFASPGLRQALRQAGADTLILSGGETDVCVLATAMTAVDLGFRVIVATDAVCSSSDEGHDRLLALFHDRFGQQVETADSDSILSAWPA